MVGWFTVMGLLSAMLLLSAAAAPAAVTTTDLRCEYARDPLGIDVAKPRLSWRLESAERGQAQTAYRVLVAGSESKLAGDAGDLWDSGKVESDASAQVVYGGKPLGSRAAAYWKVQVWDKNGQPSPWSEPGSWRMGLLDAADWAAQWIGAAGACPSPMVRKGFRLEGPVKRAYAYVSALGLYELRINGERVGENILAPEWTNYNERVQYQTYDVTRLLERGDNAVGAMLGEGWYAGRIGLGNLRDVYGQRARLILRLEVELEDGSTHVVVSDGSWRATTDGPIRHACLLDGEVYDARKEMPGWDRPGFDDAAWKPVEVQAQVRGRLVAQPNEPIRVVEELEPVAITEPAPGVYVFDLGQNMVGWCRLTVEGAAGTTVTLRHAEMLGADGNVYRDNLRLPADDGPKGARQIDQRARAS